MLSKANSLSGTNPIKPCVNYAQLHKTLCIDEIRCQVFIYLLFRFSDARRGAKTK
jgi:hypothetical protein